MFFIFFTLFFMIGIFFHFSIWINLLISLAIGVLLQYTITRIRFEILSRKIPWKYPKNTWISQRFWVNILEFLVFLVYAMLMASYIFYQLNPLYIKGLMVITSIIYIVVSIKLNFLTDEALNPKGMLYLHPEEEVENEDEIENLYNMGYSDFPENIDDLDISESEKSKKIKVYKVYHSHNDTTPPNKADLVLLEKNSCYLGMVVATEKTKEFDPYGKGFFFHPNGEVTPIEI